MSKKFYITCAIPYVNANPHIGHALEFVEGDTIARYHKFLGKDVLLLSGGDENSLKNVQAAESQKENVQDFVDKNTENFFKLTKNLDCNFDVWQKGSNQKTHFPSSQKLWELCDKNGDIYKKSYEGLYCVGCETFYTPDELNDNGECFEHPGKKLDKVKEENYFFALSKYQKKLIDLITSDEIKITPIERKNETLSFLKKPLQDISISRTNERARNWGVPVPGDPSQKFYVWFDALNIYQSGIGFGWDDEMYKKWWPADVHVIGKGITRFHAIYWPAFLLSANLKLPKEIFIHGYFTVNGQKMSKTLGNVVDPNTLIEKYGADALRYYLLAKFSPFTDGDFSEEKLIDVYNGDLANGLGNLVSRVSKLCEKENVEGLENYKGEIDPVFDKVINDNLSNYRFDQALLNLWNRIKIIDQDLNQDEPWKIEDKDLLKRTLRKYVEGILDFTYYLSIFMPDTAQKINNIFGQEKIVSSEPLFPRIK